MINGSRRQLRRAIWAQLRNCSSLDKQIRTPVSRFLSRTATTTGTERRSRTVRNRSRRRSTGNARAHAKPPILPTPHTESVATQRASTRVPVSLLITYDPNRFAHNVPGNVHRYINLYQSSNVLGGGDLAPVRGFHGNYASFNLKNRSEVIHVNLDKFPHIQEILASKIRSAGVPPKAASRCALSFRPAFRSSCGTVGLRSAHAGDTLQRIASAYHVPLWTLTQLNKVSETAALTEGQRIVIPYDIGQKLPSTQAQNPASSDATQTGN